MEEWKDVKGLEGKLQVSSYGRVKRIENGKTKFLGNFAYKSSYENRYIVVYSHTHRFLVHRLVATHFIPNPNNLPLVRHLDTDKTNNHVSNLAWGTHSDNMKDMWKDKREREKYDDLRSRILLSILSNELRLLSEKENANKIKFTIMQERIFYDFITNW